jgi:hypothetical protein
MMEQVSIRSFLHHGHEFHLYLYDPITGVPEGTTICNADEILPREEIFYRKHGFGAGSPASFSNLFRYMLLIKKGNWWVDTDIVCLKPFDFGRDHVVGSERLADGRVSANCAVIKAPIDSPFIWHCYRFCRSIDQANAAWGCTGPRLVERAIHELKMVECLEAPSVFYPVDYWQIGQLFEDRPIPAGSHSVHLYHAVWRHYDIDPNGTFPPECMWENLRRQFLPEYVSPRLSEPEITRLRSRLARTTTPRQEFLQRLRNRVRSLLGTHRNAG